VIKKKGESQIGNLTPDHKSLESRGEMRFSWKVLYIVGKIFSRDIKYWFFTLKKLDLKKI
jgi:hypothetical protein